jgi:hypothetical protein
MDSRPAPFIYLCIFTIDESFFAFAKSALMQTQGLNVLGPSARTGLTLCRRTPPRRPAPFFPRLLPLICLLSILSEPAA